MPKNVINISRYLYVLTITKCKIIMMKSALGSRTRQMDTTNTQAHHAWAIMIKIWAYKGPNSNLLFMVLI